MNFNAFFKYFYNLTLRLYLFSGPTLQNESECKGSVSSRITQTSQIKRRKAYLSCSDNIWATDLAEIRSLSFFSSGVKYLLYAIDVFTKYAWVKPLKDKKDKTILDGFIGIVN